MSKKKKKFNANRVKTLPNAKRRFQENAHKGMNMAMKSKKMSAQRHHMFRRKAG